MMKLRPDQSLREEERRKWKVRGRGEEEEGGGDEKDAVLHKALSPSEGG